MHKKVYMIYFVTGTDTDSGKTLISSALLHSAKLNDPKVKSCGLKPIASGCAVTEDGLRNADALALMNEATVKLDYDVVNPFAFVPAIAPHIAAKQSGKTLSAQQIVDTLINAPIWDADVILIEGAGGWRLPLGEGEYLSDSVKLLQQAVCNKNFKNNNLNNALQRHELGVILVVGMKLGCLNHALLTQEAILNDGLPLVGWVANQVAPNMAEIDENLESLKAMIAAPFMGYVPFLSDPSPRAAAEYLTCPKL
jgi:dethiobiotin synthetase